MFVQIRIAQIILSGLLPEEPVLKGRCRKFYLLSLVHVRHGASLARNERFHVWLSVSAAVFSMRSHH